MRVHFQFLQANFRPPALAEPASLPLAAAVAAGYFGPNPPLAASCVLMRCIRFGVAPGISQPMRSTNGSNSGGGGGNKNMRAFSLSLPLNAISTRWIDVWICLFLYLRPACSLTIAIELSQLYFTLLHVYMCERSTNKSWQTENWCHSS